MLAIRLTRIGKKNSPAYRVVVADKKRAVQRKFIEVLGHYNPALKPKQLEINKERALFWIGRGAQASDTVHNLMANLGILDKKVNKIYAKKKVDEIVAVEQPKVEAKAEATETETTKEASETDETAKKEPEVAQEKSETQDSPAE